MNKEDLLKINGKTEQEFLSSYNYSFTSVSKIGLDWAKLVEIHDFYKGIVVNKLEVVSQMIFLRLKGIKGAHSVKYRVKDPEHLVEKIIRKKKDHKEGDNYREITIDNFLDEFDDLIGFRILHLFKTDWEPIFVALRGYFNSKECPVAYYRKGDDSHFIERCKELEVNPVEKEAGYRSIHYIAVVPFFETSFSCEIQIRTVFEEAWSEIDHLVRYPYYDDNILLREYLLILNRLVGCADDMGVFLMTMKNNLENQQKERARLETVASELRKEVSRLEKTNNIKKDKIDSLIKQLNDNVTTNSFIGLTGFNDYISQINNPSGSSINPLTATSLDLGFYSAEKQPYSFGHFEQQDPLGEKFSPILNSAIPGSGASYFEGISSLLNPRLSGDARFNPFNPRGSEKEYASFPIVNHAEKETTTSPNSGEKKDPKKKTDSEEETDEGKDTSA